MSQTQINNAHKKSLKATYKYLNPRQKRLVKLHEAKIQAEKFLYGIAGFYATAPRLKNNHVDFENLDERILDYFEDANKDIEKYNKIDDEEMQNALDLFNKTQFSYSQSF